MLVQNFAGCQAETLRWSRGFSSPSIREGGTFNWPFLRFSRSCYYHVTRDELKKRDPVGIARDGGGGEKGEGLSCCQEQSWVQLVGGKFIIFSRI